MPPARCAAYAAPSTPQVSSIAHTRRAEEQLCQVWLRGLQSLPERVGACWGALQSRSQALGTAQPGWVCSALPSSPRAGGVISAFCSKGSAPTALPGAGERAQPAVSPQELPVPYKS